MKKKIQYGIQGLGIVVSIYAFFFWIVYLFNLPIDASGYSSGSGKFILPGGMIAASLITAWASFFAKPKLLFIFSLLSFFPVGVYFIGGNSSFYVSLGVAYFCLVLAALVLLVNAAVKR